MRRTIIVAGLVAAGWAAVAVRPATPQPPADKRPGLFSTLKVGQAVTIKERTGRYTVSTMDGIGGESRITEIGDDYIAVRDAAGLTETRVPVSAVSAVVHTALK